MDAELRKPLVYIKDTNNAWKVVEFVVYWVNDGGIMRQMTGDEYETQIAAALAEQERRG
jgi:hypothetical protein